MSAPHGSHGAPPPRGATLLRTDDYVSGHMSDADADAFEEELFAAPDAAGDAAFVDDLARLLAVCDADGGLVDGGTRAQVDALRAAGARVHFADLGGGGAPVAFPGWDADEIDVVVARLGVDLRGYESVDVEVETGDGRPVKTFRDVACDPTDGALYAICREPLARLAFGKGRTISRIIATQGGRRTTVAVFQVTPF